MAAALLVAAGCALAAGADTFVAAPAPQRCVFHLHTPKCAGTFVWRFLKGRFCADEARICGRDALRPPPACACVVNPITKDEAVLGAIRRGAYAFASSHSRAPFKSSTACALAVWFREPLARVRSHYGYFKYKKHRNLTSLADLYKRGIRGEDESPGEGCPARQRLSFPKDEMQRRGTQSLPRAEQPALRDAAENVVVAAPCSRACASRRAPRRAFVRRAS